MLAAIVFEEMQALIRRRQARSVYRIVPDPATVPQVAALPNEALDAYAEVLEMLQLTPWASRPQHEDNLEGAVQRWKSFSLLSEANLALAAKEVSVDDRRVCVGT